VRYVRKALIAGVVAFGGALTTANLDGVITTDEWWGIAGTTVVALAGTWAVPNALTVQQRNRVEDR
jgi:hypothetical protein